MLAVQADLFAILKAQHGFGHALAADLDAPDHDERVQRLAAILSGPSTTSPCAWAAASPSASRCSR